jgi:hypothetical protein
MLPRGFAAVKDICIGALPTVASPVVGVAEIEVLCVEAGADPGGTGVELELPPPPPQATRVATASSDRQALRTVCTANLEVMFIVVAPSSPSGFVPAANFAYGAQKKNSGVRMIGSYRSHPMSRCRAGFFPIRMDSSRIYSSFRMRSEEARPARVNACHSTPR